MAGALLRSSPTRPNDGDLDDLGGVGVGHVVRKRESQKWNGDSGHYRCRDSARDSLRWVRVQGLRREQEGLK